MISVDVENSQFGVQEFVIEDISKDLKYLNEMI